MFEAGTKVKLFSDDKELQGAVKDVKLNKKQEITLSIPCNGGIVVTNN